MHKEVAVHINTIGYYLTLKIEEIDKDNMVVLVFKDLQGLMLRKTEKDKYCMISLICGI